ncbi:MAG: Flp pilus assembly protein CpaB [Anderseniella sp.]
MSKSRFLVMGVAAVAAGAAAFLANGFLGQPQKAEVVEVNKIAMTPVLVTLKDIRIGEVLDASNLGWKDWPSNQVSQFMVTRDGSADVFEELKGARARAGLYEGEPLNKRRIVEVGDRGFMAAVLPKGMRAISIRVSPETGAGGFILPNDRVDVLLTRKLSGNRDISETVLTNVRVLAIDQQIKTTEDGGQVIVGKTATLELEPVQSEVLALVESAGQLSLALRSLADVNNTKLGDDGPRTSKKYARGSKGTIRQFRYGIMNQIANTK